MFENEWFPKANAIGITWEQFWTLNPHIIMCMIKGHNERIKEEMDILNFISHLIGRYVADSILCTVGNMFSGKTAKKYKYPDKPYELNGDKELTEEELQKQRELFVAKLMVMKSNFEINHKDSNSK